MSTQETVIFDVGPCPCGAGRILNHVTTQDNPWSGADSHVQLACASCAATWRLEDRRLVLTNSEAPVKLARATLRAAQAARDTKVKELVTDFFEKLAAPTKKAEHQKMVQLGVTTDSYPGYLRRRRNGADIASTVTAYANPTWLHGLAAAAGCGQELAGLEAAVMTADAAWRDELKQVVTFAFDTTIRLGK